MSSRTVSFSMLAAATLDQALDQALDDLPGVTASGLARINVCGRAVRVGDGDTVAQVRARAVAGVLASLSEHAAWERLAVELSPERFDVVLPIGGGPLDPAAPFPPDVHRILLRARAELPSRGTREVTATLRGHNIVTTRAVPVNDGDTVDAVRARVVCGAGDSVILGKLGSLFIDLGQFQVLAERGPEEFEQLDPKALFPSDVERISVHTAAHAPAGARRRAITDEERDMNPAPRAVDHLKSMADRVCANLTDREREVLAQRMGARAPIAGEEELARRLERHEALHEALQALGWAKEPEVTIVYLTWGYPAAPDQQDREFRFVVRAGELEGDGVTSLLELEERTRDAAGDFRWVALKDLRKWDFLLASALAACCTTVARHSRDEQGRHVVHCGRFPVVRQ